MKIKIKPIIEAATKVLKKHAPEVLTGIGVVGMGTAVVLAVKATSKAKDLIDDECERQEVESLSFGKKVKVAWKCYIPTAIALAGGSASVIFATKASLNRQAALAAACAVSEAAAAKYKDKVVEVLGEKQEKAIVHDSIKQDEVDQHPVSKTTVLSAAGGDTLCYDSWSGQYFNSDRDTIQRAINELNEIMYSENEVSLNDLYSILDINGLKTCKMGNNFGWEVNGGMVRAKFSSCLSENGTPCLVLDYAKDPKFLGV